MSTTCECCEQKVSEEDAQRRCWGCAKLWHSRCLKKPVDWRGPWHCDTCQRRYQSAGTRDITLDRELVWHLNGFALPEPALARCRRVAKYVSLGDDGRLRVRGRHYTELEVPPLYARLEVVRHAAGTLAFPDGDRLYQLLRQRFFWAGLRRDCLLVTQSLVSTQKERARFKSQPHLYPTEKAAAPFLYWAVDTIVGFQPPHPDTGATSVVIGVDCFGKWVEGAPLARLDSHHTAAWFHEEVVCRYGTPLGVRTDRGSEYKGQFARYCKLAGVQ